MDGALPMCGQYSRGRSRTSNILATSVFSSASKASIAMFSARRWGLGYFKTEKPATSPGSTSPARSLFRRFVGFSGGGFDALAPPKPNPPPAERVMRESGDCRAYCLNGVTEMNALRRAKATAISDIAVH